MNVLPNGVCTLAQINPVVGDIAGNGRMVESVIKAQSHQGLIVFPELVITGYPPEDLVLRPSFMRAVEDEIARIQRATKAFKGCAVISTPWVVGGMLCNAVLAISGGEITAVVPKHHLPNYGVFDEKRIFEAGPLPVPFEFGGRRVGVMTCEDAWRPDTARSLKEHGAEILVVPNASPFDEAKYAARLHIMKERCAETALPAVYVNIVGGQDEVVFDGGSFIMDADGAVVHAMPFFEECVSTVGPDAPALILPEREAVPERLGQLYGAMCLGLRDYVCKNGFKGILIGLSGGIDSALSAAIACDAIGADKVRCVMMPSPYTADISIADSEALVKNLGCGYESIPIAPGMEVFDTMLGREVLQGLAGENIQSRMRGMILMALSNAGGYMVLSTGNKSEMAMGYATLYGDMCGGFNALKDLYKTDVFAVSCHVNAMAGYARIPERIITRPPSAELRPDQKDEDSLPPYGVLDAILRGIIEGRMSVPELCALGFERETVIRVRGLLDRAEYKRRQAPPGVKLTTTAFGRERRYPMTNGWREGRQGE